MYLFLQAYRKVYIFIVYKVVFHMKACEIYTIFVFRFVQGFYVCLAYLWITFCHKLHYCIRTFQWFTIFLNRNQLWWRVLEIVMHDKAGLRVVAVIFLHVKYGFGIISLSTGHENCIGWNLMWCKPPE